MRPTFRDYIEYAEKHLMVAQDEIERSMNPSSSLISATVLAWSAIESLVNNMLDDFDALPKDVFELHERAFLREKKLRFKDSGAEAGQFVLEGSEYRRLGDKILFLAAKFGKQSATTVKGHRLWDALHRFKDVRNALVHPRRTKEVTLTASTVEEFIDTAKSVINLVSEHVWKKKVRF